MSKKIWSCKIGFTAEADLPEGADQPMREAVLKAYETLTSRPADFVFSGWGGELTEHEVEELENDDRLAEL